MAIRRSRFEERIEAKYLRGKIPYKYEEYSYAYEISVPRTKCADCGSKNIETTRSYTPDYFLNNGVIIELKGKLDAKERKKLLAVREAHEDLKDLKLVFMRDNKIHRRSKTRYSEWAEANGFDYAVNHIPSQWLEEK